MKKIYTLFPLVLSIAHLLQKTTAKGINPVEQVTKKGRVLKSTKAPTNPQPKKTNIKSTKSPAREITDPATRIGSLSCEIDEVTMYHEWVWTGIGWVRCGG